MCFLVLFNEVDVGIFKLRLESAIRVTAGSEWLDDGIFLGALFHAGGDDQQTKSSLSDDYVIR